MYMYYLLGYKYFGSLQKMEELYERDPFDRDQKSKEFIGFGNLLKNIDSKIRTKVEDFFRVNVKKNVYLYNYNTF